MKVSLDLDKHEAQVLLAYLLASRRSKDEYTKRVILTLAYHLEFLLYADDSLPSA